MEAPSHGTLCTGEVGSTLQAASYAWQEKVVHMLMDAGARGAVDGQHQLLSPLAATSTASV